MNSRSKNYKHVETCLFATCFSGFEWIAGEFIRLRGGEMLWYVNEGEYSVQLDTFDAILAHE